MAVREYIGARYVPLMATPIQWEIANTYEPLTIVINEGNSYTSRQFVPVGIDISNIDYWALTGNYNAQVEQYRQEVARVVDDVANVKTDINEIDTEIVELKSENVEINNKISSIDLMGGIAVAAGDSITRGFGLSNPESDNWFSQLCTALGWVGYNYAVDGASFTSMDGNKGFSGQLKIAAADQKFNNDDVKYVVIGGGINDHGQAASNIELGVRTTISQAKTSFKNAKIIVLPNLCSNFPLNNINQGDSQYIHADSSMIILNQLSYLPNLCVFGDAFKWLQGRNNCALDQVHPNKNGATVIANYTYSSLLGSKPNNIISAHPIYDENVTSVSTNSEVNGLCNGDSWRYYGVIRLPSGSTIAAGKTLIDLGSLALKSRNEITPVNISNLKIQIPAYMQNGVLKLYQTALTADTATDYYWEVSGSVGV